MQINWGKKKIIEYPNIIINPVTRQFENLLQDVNSFQFIWYIH